MKGGSIERSLRTESAATRRLVLGPWATVFDCSSLWLCQLLPRYDPVPASTPIPSSNSLTVASLSSSVLIRLAATAHDTPTLTVNAGPLLRSRQTIIEANLTITLDDVKSLQWAATIYRRRTPTLFASCKGGVKEAAYDTTIPTDLIRQDPNYCRPFMKTPEIRDRMSKISSPTIPFSSIIFSLIPFFSFSRRARGYAAVTGPTFTFASCQSVNQVFPFHLSIPQAAFQAFLPHCPIPAFFRFSQDAPPSFMSSSEKASTMLGSVKGEKTAPPLFSPHILPRSLTFKRDPSAIPNAAWSWMFQVTC